MQITLPEPPSANRYWRTYRGKVVPSTEAKRYKAAVALLASRSKPIPAGTPCSVLIRWYRGIRSGDLDNRIKVLLDALKGLAFEDDGQVVELHAYRHDDAGNPRVEVDVVRSPSGEMAA